MTPERISRSTRIAHGLVACNFPPQAILLPSPRSAVCIIARRVVPRGIGGTLRMSPPNCPQFIFEQGQVFIALCVMPIANQIYFRLRRSDAIERPPQPLSPSDDSSVRANLHF